jgi:hypothetical protein
MPQLIIFNKLLTHRVCFFETQPQTDVDKNQTLKIFSSHVQVVWSLSKVKRNLRSVFRVLRGLNVKDTRILSSVLLWVTALLPFSVHLDKDIANQVPWNSCSMDFLLKIQEFISDLSFPLGSSYHPLYISLPCLHLPHHPSEVNRFYQRCHSAIYEAYCLMSLMDTFS